MAGIVLELQKEVVSTDCDVVSVLRRAHLIAAKLELSDFDHWIEYELNGYPNQETCPEYRKIRGTLKALNPYHGWIPTLIPNAQVEKMICEQKIVNSISEIISLSESSDAGLISEFSGEFLATINGLFDSPLPMKYALHIPKTAVKDIVEKVKNTILEWTLKLEKEGVIGENMVFSEAEKKAAIKMPQTVNNYYGNTSVINAQSDNVQIVSGNDNTVSFSYKEVESLIAEIEKSLDDTVVSKEDLELATELLAEIKNKIENEQKPKVIKSALIGLKDFLINAGASVAATLIQNNIQNLF